MFDTIKKWFARSYHNPAIPLSSPDATEYFVSTTSRSGEVVNTETALAYSPVWQAVDLISSDISRIPFVTYERVSSGSGEGKQRARSHPAYRLLRRYTGEMNANMWLQRMVAHALLYGNAYTRLKFSGNTLVGFEWLHSNRVEPRKIDGSYVYIVKDDPENEHGQKQGTRNIQPARMFHLEGLAIRQLGGMSIVQYARDTIGRARAAEGYADDYYANGGPSVMFQHPAQMSKEAQERFLRKFSERHAGMGNRFKYGMLIEGMTANTIGLSAEDATLIESMQFSVKDVARFFNIPPHKLGDDSRTSFNSVEQENMSYFNSSLGKWTSRLEFEANQKLFTKTERDEDTHFAEFKVDALFRANTMDRMNAAAIAVTNGIKSRNEIRAEENLNPYEGGDQYLTPLNLSTGDDEPEEDQDTADVGNTAPVRMLLRDVVLEAYERAANRVFLSASREAKKPEKFVAWLNSIDTKHREAITDILQVSLRACGASEDEIAEHVNTFLKVSADRLIAASQGDLIDADLAAARQAVLSHTRQTVTDFMEACA